jgi:uncharacterized protein DUF2877
MREAQRTIRAIGITAHAALARSEGMIDAMPEFRGAPFMRAAGEIIWIGSPVTAMHPRAVVMDGDFGNETSRRLDVQLPEPWRPPSPPSDAIANMGVGCAALHRDLARVGHPKGLAAMLIGEAPVFPLDGMAKSVRALASSFEAGDVDRVYDAALPLLGVGTGLTPSGDDLVGAALFGRRMLIGAEKHANAWSALAARLIDAAHTRSHAIAAALFRDLASGESFAPLHRLAACVGCKHEEAIDAARALVAIGHSSGWEMLAGFIVGVTGRLDRPAIR